jgi:CRP/FNR family transcriptional regulator
MESSQRPTIGQALEASVLLRCLTPDQRKSLAEACRMSHANRGEVIWLAGSEVEFFGLVATGFVKMVRTTGDGTDVTLELMGPGQIFGMLGTIERTGCPLSAVAVTDTWYVRIPKYAFLPLYEECGALKDGLIRLSALRLHTQNDLRARLSKGRVEERIAAILFTLADSYGERKGNTLRLKVPLTRQDIAEMAGTTVETTIRTLSRWQKLGYVRTRSHYITILDEAALNDFLRF